MHTTGQIREKFTKTPSFGVKGHSRYLILINPKSLSPVLVIMCSISISICNCFHTTRANRGKMTSKRGYPSLTPSFKGNPLTQGHKILSLKTRVLGAAHSKDFVIIACTVLIGLKGVTDKQTDEQTDTADTSTIAKTREALHHFTC